MAQQTTKEKILLATINAIEKRGIHNITTRIIADEAGVNSAALHYYYGTKEQLVEVAMRATLEHWVADTAELMSGEGTLENRLRAILNYLIDGMLRYPNIVRAHLQSSIIDGDADSPFMNLLSSWLDQASTELGQNLEPEKKTRMRIAMQSALFALLLAGLIPEKAGFNDKISLHDKNFRAMYKEYLMEGIVNSLNSVQ